MDIIEEDPAGVAEEPGEDIPTFDGNGDIFLTIGENEGTSLDWISQ